MKKPILPITLIALMTAGATVGIQSCKDYDDDITFLQEQIDQNKDLLETLKSKVESGQVITSVTSDGAGIKITLSNGETYTVTNGKDGKDGVNGTNGKDGKDGVNGTDGKDGEDGKDGKDAVVWTIGEDGFWYKDGVKTDYRAIGEKGDKGDKGEDGQDAKGDKGDKGDKGEDGKDGKDGKYYEPGEDGFWYIVDPNTDPATKTKTTITWRASDDNALSAVVKDGVLTIYNLKDAEGNPTTFSMSINGELRSIVFRPELYLDGVEGARYAYAPGVYLKATTTKKEGTDDKNAAYVIKAGSAWAYAPFSPAGTNEYSLASNDTLTFNLNPTNANLKGVNFGFTAIQNIETVSRAATTLGLTTGREWKNENGVLTMPVTASNAEGLDVASGLIPVTSLEATLENKGKVSSDYLSLLLEQTEFVSLYLDDKAPVMAGVTDRELKGTGELSITNASVLPILYNNVEGFNLKEHILVSYTSTDLASKTKSGKLTLAQLEEKWGLKADFKGLHYTLGTSITEEYAFLEVTKDGKLTARYIKEAGKDPVLTDGSAAAKSAIGKKPVVAVTICNGTNVVLAGYVKCEITEKVQDPQGPTEENVIVATSETYPILCTGDDFNTDWDQFAALFAELGCSKDFFTQNYVWENDGVTDKTQLKTYVLTNNKFVPTDKFGHLDYAQDGIGATTTILSWPYDVTSAQNISEEKDGTVTLYTKFTYGSKIVYVGMTIKVAGKPEISLGDLKPGNQVAEDKYEVMMNVPTKSSGKPVTDFKSTITNFFWDKAKEIDNVIVVTLKSGDHPYKKSDIVANDPVFTFAKTGQMSGLEAVANGSELRTVSGAQLIASINATSGELTYATSEEAKRYLNEENPWALVNIHYTYGSCNLEFGKIENENLKVDFIKPIEVIASKTDPIKYNGKDADERRLGEFFNIYTTVGNHNLFIPDGDSYKDNDGLYKFYGVEKIDVDLTKCQTYNTVTLVNATPTTNGGHVYSVDIKDPKALGNYKIRFDYNTETLIHETEVYVSLKIYYSWGIVEKTIPVMVKPYKN